MKSLNIRKMGGAAKQAGFTIIELVVVILLLGILTATALPRFLDISDDAHNAVVEAHLGSLSTGMALFRAAWFAQGKPAQVDYLGDDTPVLFASLQGYPAGLTTSPLAAAPLALGHYPVTYSDCVGIFTNLMQAGGTALTAGVATGTATTPLDAGATGTTAPLGAILAASPTGWSGADWAVTTIDDGTGVSTTPISVGCDFYYMGQFQDHGSVVRVIRYLPQSGSLGVITMNALGLVAGT